MGLWRKLTGREGLRVHLIIKGRIGEGWFDVDEQLYVPEGTTLAGLIEHAGRAGLDMAAAIADSPHLAHTLMWNGERCPVDEHADRAVADGDTVYLLAPLAGG